MWKRSLLLLLVDSLSYVFSRSRESSSPTHPAKATNPEVTAPNNSQKNEEPEKLFYFPSVYLKGEVGLSASSVNIILAALNQGDHSLCLAFGITPGDFATVLRNVGISVNPRPSEPSSSVNLQPS